MRRTLGGECDVLPQALEHLLGALARWCCHATTIAVIGCGGEGTQPTPDFTTHSGDRLKLAYFEFDDGQRTLAMSPLTTIPDIEDTALAVACTPQTWSDGIARCTPTALAAVQFLDDACTEAIVFHDTPSFAAELDTSCSPTPVALYRATNQMRTATALFQHEGGACVPVLLPPDSEIPVFVAQPQPLSTLVTVTTEVHGEGPLALRMLRGDDGLLVPLDLYDVARDFACVSSFESAAPSCQPDAPPSGVFLDDTCLAPGVTSKDACEPPKHTSFFTLGCPQFYEVASEPAVDGMRFEYFGGCQPRAPGQGEVTYPLGARLSLLELTRSPVPAAGRIQLISVGQGDVQLVDPLRLFDAGLGTECTLTPSFDGGPATCLPPPAFLESFLFSDAGCTQSLPNLVKILDPTDGCGVRAPSFILNFENDPRMVGPRHTGDVFQMLGAFCDRRFGTFYEVGDPIPMPLATAVLTRDP